MKLSRILFSAVALGALTTLTTLRAQDEKPADAPKAEHKAGKRGPMSPEQRLEMWDKQLSLTADQKAKIKDILTAGQAKVDAAGEDRQARMEAMKAINSEVRAVLTADQQAKFDQMMARGPRNGGKKKAD